jgi:PAS domain S-box-containing protein
MGKDGQQVKSWTHVVWDRSFRIQHWSDRAEEVFGWTGEEVVGRHPWDWDFVYEPDRVASDHAMERLMSGDTSRCISRVRHHTKDGELVSCEWYHFAVPDADGEVGLVQSLIKEVRRESGEEARTCSMGRAQ